MKLDDVITVVMLVCGVVVFIAALLVLKILLKRNKSLVPAYGLFSFAIVMIGFSAIKSVTLPGGASLSKETKAFEADPNNPKNIAALSATLDKHLEASNSVPLSAEARTDLAKTVASLSLKTNLSADSRITLSKAQLVLGRTNDAAAMLRSAVAIKPRLVEDPKVKVLMKHVQ